MFVTLKTLLLHQEQLCTKDLLMKIVIIGANGFTGRRILSSLKDKHEVIACSRHADILPEEGYYFKQLDILNYKETESFLDSIGPEIIINASALSAVDYCEQHREEAYAINVTAVKHLAEYCQRTHCRLIHLSTDFVFDGTATDSYTEDMLPHPVNYYGMTKLQGEEAIVQACADYAIVRVEVVYGKPWQGQHGNIVHLVKTRLESGQGIRVVNDQFRSPTWVEDIARGIHLLLTSKHRGIYHICGGETMSVAELAMRVAQYFRLDTSLIESVTTEEMNEATPRPFYSPMSIAKAQCELGYSPSSFETGLQEWL